jgi:hypothetical protein
MELTFDEAYVQLGDDKGPFLRAGKYYMPFAQSETFGFEYNLVQRWLLANPVALGLGYNHKYFGVSAHMFNGRNDTSSSSGREDNDIIDTYAAGLDFSPLAMFEKHSLDLGGYFLTDATETWGNLGRLFNGTRVVLDANGNPTTESTVNYSENVPMYGGYLVGRFTLSDLLGLGVRGEYATTGEFDKKDYVDAKGKATAVTWMNAELAFLFWEGVIGLGGKYESISGVDYFGPQMPAGVNLAPPNETYEPTSYSHYGGFFTTNLMEELTIGLEYLYGKDSEDNSDMELQVQTRLDF